MTGLDKQGAMILDEVGLPDGFEFNGIHCGIKSSPAKDLSLVKTEDNKPVLTAAVFTTNEICAAPVVVSKESLSASGGLISAVLLNSGNANAATGAKGIKTVRDSAIKLAEVMGCDTSNILVCSTGLIGIPLDPKPILDSIVTLEQESQNSIEAFKEAAEAILTTDTVAKTFSVQPQSKAYKIAGFAKGAAMLAPAMATMLTVVVTDADIKLDHLRSSLNDAVEDSFNSILVDGCMSTNDTVIIMTSGKYPVKDLDEFSTLLKRGLQSLAYQMVKDAEGGTVVAHLTIEGAVDSYQAMALARKVAQSVLVRCSLNGRDPYWGRIISELGAAGVNIDPGKVQISYGDYLVADGGVAAAHDIKGLAEYMQNDEIAIGVNLNLGASVHSMIFCDISHGYLDENRKTS